MRIVGGEMKGRLIKAPSTDNLRPSMERTREAIFSVLGDDIVDASVADLFCGSGALGLEALSRGATRALFIDSSKAAIRAVRKNTADLGLAGRAVVYEGSVFHLRPGKLKDISIVFADPPYEKGYGDRLITLLCLKNSSFDGILILEHEKGWSYEGSDCEIMRRLDFGDSSVTFLKVSLRVA
ncbi:MAG: 16S rRNA (guanine(966)-N(2))-methyltransferase RsmD [candidate division Zixibacteria bacterium]